MHFLAVYSFDKDKKTFLNEASLEKQNQGNIERIFNEIQKEKKCYVPREKLQNNDPFCYMREIHNKFYLLVMKPEVDIQQEKLIIKLLDDIQEHVDQSMDDFTWRAKIRQILITWNLSERQIVNTFNENFTNFDATLNWQLGVAFVLAVTLALIIKFYK